MERLRYAAKKMESCSGVDENMVRQYRRARVSDITRRCRVIISKFLFSHISVGGPLTRHWKKKRKTRKNHKLIRATRDGWCGEAKTYVNIKIYKDLYRVSQSAWYFEFGNVKKKFRSVIFHRKFNPPEILSSENSSDWFPMKTKPHQTLCLEIPSQSFARISYLTFGTPCTQNTYYRVSCTCVTTVTGLNRKKPSNERNTGESNAETLISYIYIEARTHRQTCINFLWYSYALLRISQRVRCQFSRPLGVIVFVLFLQFNYLHFSCVITHWVKLWIESNATRS